MKKKEREHLKEDPFINFIENILAKLKQYKREILLALGLFAAVAVVIVVILFIRSQSLGEENRIYSQALSIKNSTTLTVDDKISQLSQLEVKSGISAAGKLILASLHFERGDMVKAEEVLDHMPASNLKLIENQKEVLRADIMAASQKSQEALGILNKLLADSTSEISKDFLLMKISVIQIQSGQNGAAADNLKKLINEFPDSFYTQEAQTLLDGLDLP